MSSQRSTFKRGQGRYVPVRAEVHLTNAYSAHADAEQMLMWLSALKPPDTAYVVHREEDAAWTLAARRAGCPHALADSGDLFGAISAARVAARGKVAKGHGVARVMMSRLRQ